MDGIIEGEKKYIITEETTKNLKAAQNKKIELFTGHAYTVLLTLEIDQGSGPKNQKIKEFMGKFRIFWR